MKYRLAAGALLIAVLGALAVLISDDQAYHAPTQQPGADDAAMKSLNLN